MNPKYKYDICLSFAGEDRPYVDKVAAALKDKGIRIFYDQYEQEDLWGKDLYQHLDYVYQHMALFCVIFISSHYAKKMWAKHELRSAQARAFRENQEYILPARFDSTAIPGLPDTVGYIDLRSLSAEKFAQKICAKLDRAVQKNKSQSNGLRAKSKTNLPDPSRVAIKKVNLKKAVLTKPNLKRR